MNFKAITASMLSTAVTIVPVLAQSHGHVSHTQVTHGKAPILTAIGCGIDDFNDVAYSRLVQVTRNNPHHVVSWAGGITTLDDEISDTEFSIAAVGVSVLCNNVRAGNWSLVAGTDVDFPSEHMFAATTGQDADGFLFSFNGDVIKTTLNNSTERWNWNVVNTFDPFEHGEWPTGSTITNFWVADAGLNLNSIGQLIGDFPQFTFDDTITNVTVNGVAATGNTHQGLAFDCNGIGLAVAGLLTGLNS